MPSPAMVAIITCIIPGTINEWFSKYLPMTVVPDLSKFTVAMSDG